MRRLGLSVAADLLPQIWRCVLATVAMALVLWAMGLGWRPMEMALLPVAIGVGAVVYAASLIVLWSVSGRPAGPG